MSVPKNQRSETKLRVLQQAREVCVYTLSICKNEKIFPKNSRWLLTAPIVNQSIEVLNKIRMANAVRVENQNDFAYRRRLQKEAYSYIEALLGLMDVAYEVLSIVSSKIEYWTRIVCELESSLKAWMRTDTERYKNI